MDEQVLQNGRGFGFAADREIGAAGAFGGLFTLKAEHIDDLVFCFCWLCCRLRGGCGKKMPDRVRPGIDAGQRKPENQPTIIPPKA
jgi:hypothetical protein